MAEHNARVPMILQNDAGSPLGFKCGAAAIQAILYGQDDAFFNPAGSDDLKAGIPLRDDQDHIWEAVKEASVAVAKTLGLGAGGSEPRQICDPASVPRCWATHPSVMEKLLNEGIGTTSATLQGLPGIKAQQIPESQVVPFAMATLEKGIGAAVLIHKRHWVVIRQIVERADGDRDIFFRDPLTEVDTLWPGVAKLQAALLDSGRLAATMAGTQVMVVGAEFAGDGPPAPEHDAGPSIASSPFAGQELDASSAELWPSLVEALLTRGSQVARDKLAQTELNDSAAAPLVLPVREVPTLVGDIGADNQLSTADDQARRAAGARAFYVLSGRDTIIVVDAATRTPQLVATAISADRPLPTILAADELIPQLDGRRIQIDGVDVTLDKNQFRIDPQLVWEHCDQSRSMLKPFYVLRQPRDGGGEHIVYVRVDGFVFTELTNTLGGA